VRLHADGNDEGAKGLGLSGVGVGKGVDTRPTDAESVEASVDLLADSEPSGPDVVTVDGARLSNDALAVWTVVPRRAGLEHAGRAATVEVGIGVRVPVCEARRLISAVHELRECLSGRDGKMVFLNVGVLRDGDDTGFDKTLVDVERNSGRHYRRENKSIISDEKKPIKQRGLTYNKLRAKSDAEI